MIEYPSEITQLIEYHLFPFFQIFPELQDDPALTFSNEENIMQDEEFEEEEEEEVDDHEDPVNTSNIDGKQCYSINKIVIIYDSVQLELSIRAQNNNLKKSLITRAINLKLFTGQSIFHCPI